MRAICPFSVKPLHVWFCPLRQGKPFESMFRVKYLVLVSDPSPLLSVLSWLSDTMGIHVKDNVATQRAAPAPSLPLNRYLHFLLRLYALKSRASLSPGGNCSVPNTYYLATHSFRPVRSVVCWGRGWPLLSHVTDIDNVTPHFQDLQWPRPGTPVRYDTGNADVSTCVFKANHHALLPDPIPAKWPESHSNRLVSEFSECPIANFSTKWCHIFTLA